MIIALMSFGSSANADEFVDHGLGTMSMDEIRWVDSTIPDSHTRSQVEYHCDCTGEVLTYYTYNGNPARDVWYDGIDQYDEKEILYVKRDDDKWHAYKKADCYYGLGCSWVPSS